MGLKVHLTLPQWFPAKQGTTQDVFSIAEGKQNNPGIVDEVVLVPVYNAFCLSTTDTTLR